jgi:glycosyltransferase involved in cell wall biosynthesis
MRILVVIYEYPPIGGGGGQAAQDICRELVRRGHTLDVITSHYKGLPRLETPNPEGPGALRILRIPAARRLPYKADLLTMSAFIVSGLWHAPRFLRDLSKAGAGRRPDLIHVHFAVPSGPLAWALSGLWGAPYVLTAHLGDVPHGVPEKTGGWFRWIYPLTPPIWNKAVRVVAVSEHTRQLARLAYPQCETKMQVIPNGVDLERLDPGKIAIGTPARIVFAGRFMPQKNPLRLVRTLAALKELPWRCTLVGDGPLREAVEQEIQKAGMQERFTLTGWVSPEEVVEQLGKSDILFMPSLSEGLPVIGVQALAMGLALVVSQVGGFVDLVDQGINGYLIDPGLADAETLSGASADGYIQALRELLSRPESLLAFRLASREKAAAFDIRAIGQAYEEIFLSICKAGEQKTP